MSLMHRRRFLMMASGAGAAAALGSLGWPAPSQAGGPAADDGSGHLEPSQLGRAECSSWALGSRVSMIALHRREELAQAALKAALAEVRRVEEVLSLYWPDSPLCRLNRAGSIDQPDPYLLTVLRQARAVSQLTGGAFDVTVQPLWQAYAQAKELKRLPDAGQIASARGKVDWRKLEVRPERIRLLGDGMAVTLNGIAQGFAADRALAALRQHGVSGALVNTGEVGAMGHKDGAKTWTVGVQHPRHQDAYIGLAQLSGRCVATSGDYATTFSKDRRHHHIFDPSTGQSPVDFSSVTIVAASGIEADALSTAAFVLGPKRGFELVRSRPGTEGMFVRKNGQILTTKGFPKVG